MAALRKDPLQGHWVIVAAERGLRPQPRLPNQEAPSPGPCPFCPGNESMTPPQLYAMHAEGKGAVRAGASWEVRVIPNKFPALTPHPDVLSSAGPYEQMAGMGAHEVVIESPRHDLDLADLPVDHVAMVIQTYVLRLEALYLDKRHAYVQLFKNVGREAGASLAHPHSQLLATPLVPETFQREMQRCQDHHARHQASLFQTMLHHETQFQERLVEVTADFAVLAPFASRFPFELHIVPRFACADFSSVSRSKQATLAALLHRALARLRVVLGAYPYNLVLRTCPNPHTHPLEPLQQADYRWRLEIIPRLTTAAGLELATGIFVNPTPPETAAQLLRQARA